MPQCNYPPSGHVMYSEHSGASLAKPDWQYLSKFHGVWRDARTYDRKDELVKHGYEIRITPTGSTAPELDTKG